jgi:hypothetical protein
LRTAKGFSVSANFAPAMKVSVSVSAVIAAAGVGGHVDALGLAVPDIDAAVADLGEGFAPVST